VAVPELASLESEGWWRLDDWSLEGAAVGAMSAAGRRLGWAAIAGRSVMGGLVWLGGCIVWMYGVKGGRWDEVAR
jgi:hypothetical protein